MIERALRLFEEDRGGARRGRLLPDGDQERSRRGAPETSSTVAATEQPFLLTDATSCVDRACRP
jgi:hypothetical protein